VAAGRQGRRGRAVDLLRPLAYAPPLTSEPSRAARTVPCLPPALPVGHDVRDLERGQPLRRADLPPPVPGGRLLPRAAQGVPELHDPRARGPRHAQHGPVGQGLPPRAGLQPQALGRAQLRRGQPLQDDPPPRVPARDAGLGDLAHRDRRPRAPQQREHDRHPRGAAPRRRGHPLHLRSHPPEQPADHPRLHLSLERRAGDRHLGLGPHQPLRRRAQFAVRARSRAALRSATTGAISAEGPP